VFVGEGQRGKNNGVEMLDRGPIQVGIADETIMEVVSGLPGEDTWAAAGDADFAMGMASSVGELGQDDVPGGKTVASNYFHLRAAGLPDVGQPRRRPRNSPGEGQGRV